MNSGLWTPAALAASVGMHLVAVTLVLRMPHAPRVRPAPSSVSFEIHSPPRVASKPPDRAPEPAKRLENAPRKAATVKVSSALPTPKDDAVDLSGMTLTSDGQGSTWSSAVGDGSAISSPLVAPRPRATASAAPAVTAKPAALPPVAVVAAADLAQKPRAPALDAALARNYPAGARERGASGTAKISVRIDPDGRVRRARVVSESEPGFGSACRATVLGSTWTPPRDRAGNPVATDVGYTCRFEVR
jgi:TonB family protein